jgi:hypothetical protein
VTAILLIAPSYENLLAVWRWTATKQSRVVGHQRQRVETEGLLEIVHYQLTRSLQRYVGVGEGVGDHARPIEDMQRKRERSKGHLVVV